MCAQHFNPFSYYVTAVVVVLLEINIKKLKSKQAIPSLYAPHPAPLSLSDCYFKVKIKR
jgi:hypothetical protein